MVERRNSIIVMVGLPACGKSTLSLVIAEQMAVLNKNVKIIDLDVIFSHITNRNKVDIDGKWQQARLMALEFATDALKANDVDVIIDDNNEYRSMRKPYFRLAQMRRYGYLELHFRSFTYNESLIRDSYRKNPVGPDAITNITQRIEWSDVTEKQDWCVVVEDFQQIFDYLKKGCKVPDALPLTENIVKQSQNDRHIIDLKLRKCMKELIDANPVLRHHGRQLNEIRKEIMNEDQYTGDDHVNEFIKRVNLEVK